MNEKNSLLIRREHGELVSELSNEDAGLLFKAIFHYEATGEQLELPPVVKMAFIVFRQSLDWDSDQWKEKIKARSEAGKKGMESRWRNNNNDKEDITNNNKNNNVISVNNKNNKHNRIQEQEHIQEHIQEHLKNKKIKDLPPKSAATDCRDLVEEVQEKPPERDSEPIEAKEKSKEPEKAKKTQGYTPAFERFWSLYPQRNGKRGSKDQAFECWNRQLQGKYVKNGAAPPTERQLTAAVRAYADFCAQTTQYPQDARTWLGPGNHWREFMPDADMPNAPPGFDLRAYCTNADGEVDLKKFARTQRAMEGDDNYAEYLPECFRAPT